jgi:signal transduction histidine kinase
MDQLLQRLGVSHRLGLISILFLIPDGVLLTLFVVAINGHIDFANLERKGNQFQAPLEELLRLIPEHHWALHCRPEPNGIAEDPSLKAREIESTFDELLQLNDAMGGALSFTKSGLSKRNRDHLQVPKVKARWVELKRQAVSLTAEESMQRHHRLMEDVRGMITHVGDNSNLILDPDLDTYYLMDVTLLALPQTQERIVSVMHLTRDLLQRTAVSVRDRAEVHAQAALLEEADLIRVEASAFTALREDANFHGTCRSLQEKLPAAIQEYSKRMRRYLSLLDRFADPSLEVKPDTLWTAGHEARAASFRLWRVGSQQLEVMLHHRVSHYRWRRAMSFILSGCALCAALSLVALVNRSIRLPLQRQANALQTANDSLRNEIAERCSAELRLKEVHAKLMIASREAGMAEVATGVLHNVGNVLNSVNVSVGRLRESLEESRVSQLARVSSLLNDKREGLVEFLTKDPQGLRLPDFLEQLTRRLHQENNDLRAEVGSLEHSVHHIKQIVSTQQGLAKVGVMIEVLDPDTLLAEALQICQPTCERNRVRIERSAVPYAEVAADRHKSLQILINLIQNASQALEECSGDRVIRLTIRPTASDRIEIGVSDNGAGIPSENLARVFQHGFTSRKDGHGFGLHSAAILAQQMHGTLKARSEGAGCGATFTLELPAARTLSRSAA